MLPAVNTRPSSHPDHQSRPGLAGVVLRYPVMPRPEDWVIPEGSVSESVPHNEAARTLELVLVGWAKRCVQPVAIARNLAIRFYQARPQLGIDPDVCVLIPPPPGFEELSSLCLWKEGHRAPPLCIEVVSLTHPNKDYTTIQDRYAAMGGHEVVVFDPLLAGPHAFGGPVPLQLWRRDAMGLLERLHAGQGPAFSEVLGAWLVPDGRLLAIAEDREGLRRWQTSEQLERTEKEHERAEKEQERAQRIELERRLAALEAKR
jgi:hypothetical protein